MASRPRPLRILFCCEAVTLAHVARPALLAQAALSDPNTVVHFAAARSFDFVLANTQLPTLSGPASQSTGSPFESLERSHRFQRHLLESHTPAAFQSILDTGGILFDEPRLQRYVEQELNLFTAIKPDLVIGDLRPSLSVSCAVAGVPLWTITNGYWSPLVEPLTPPFPVFKRFRESFLPYWIRRLGLSLISTVYPALLPRILELQGQGVNAVRARYNLKPFASYLDGFVFGDRVLLADTPSLAPLSKVPSHYSFLGALSWSPQVALPEWWTDIPSDRPVAYLSMGSSGPLEIIETALSELDAAGYTTLLSTGGRRLPSVAKYASVLQTDFLPGDLASAKATLVITNGGSPTSYQALTAARPVLGIPTNMDQLLAMARVESAGGGISLRSDLFNARSFRRALSSLHQIPLYRNNATRLSTELRDYNAQERFLKLLHSEFESDFGSMQHQAA